MVLKRVNKNKNMKGLLHIQKAFFTLGGIGNHVAETSRQGASQQSVGVISVGVVQSGVYRYGPGTPRV